jgi:hypothetical protein
MWKVSTWDEIIEHAPKCLALPSISPTPDMHSFVYEKKVLCEALQDNHTTINEAVRSAIMDFEFSTESIVSLHMHVLPIANISSIEHPSKQMHEWSCGTVRFNAFHSNPGVISGITIIYDSEWQQRGLLSCRSTCIAEPTTKQEVQGVSSDVHFQALRLDKHVRNLHWRWQYLMWANRAARWAVLLVSIGADPNNFNSIIPSLQSTWEVVYVDASPSAHETFHIIDRDRRRSNTNDY